MGQELAAASVFRIAVAGSPSTTIAPLVPMLKAAVLYGDEVLLHTPVAAIVGSIATYVNARDDVFFAQSIELAEAVEPTLRDKFRILREQHGVRTNAELIGLADPRTVKGSRLRPAKRRELLNALEGMRSVVMPMADQQYETAGFPLIDAALRSGVIRILPVPAGSGTGDWLEEQFFAGIDEVLRDPNTYPVFDDDLVWLVRRALEFGGVAASEFGLLRATQASTAERFVCRLPTFPRATMDELVDIRHELRQPLLTFRAAMVEVSRGYGVTVFDDGYSEAVQTAWIEQVAPALSELDELSRSKRLLRTYGLELATGGVASAAAGLTASLTMQEPLAAQFIAVAAAVGTVTIRGAHRREEALARLNQHPYYFLYRTEELLR